MQHHTYCVKTYSNRIWLIVSTLPHTQQLGLPCQFLFTNDSAVGSLLCQACHRKTFTFKGTLHFQRMSFNFSITIPWVRQLCKDFVENSEDFSRVQTTLSCPCSSNWLEVKFHLSEFKNVVPSLFLAKATRRLRLEVKFHLSEFEKRRPLTFLAKATCRLSLEVKFHLSEFENAIPSVF
jgi:hypothetical protein